MAGHQKIIFEIEQDADGYPPVGAEGVWTREQGENRFVVDNIPFFATQATMGDVIEAVTDGEVLRYTATIEHTGNSLIRVHPYEGTNPAEVRKALEDMGCATEWLAEYALIAVNVPPSVKLTAVQEILARGAAEGKWDYEEPLLRQ
ncbi:MAG: DUF4265 domain-containing protein [Minicystis sp.]